MTRKFLSRRTFLRGTLGGAAVSVGLPTLDAMLTPSGAHADGSTDGPFFGVFFWANGLPWHGGHGAQQAAGEGGQPVPPRDDWTPRQELWTPSPPPLLAPLARHRVSLATGLTPHTEIPPRPAGQGDGHMRGFMVAMTGDRPRSQGFNHSAHTLTALRPTLDQVVARDPRFYTHPVRFRSVQLGVSRARFHEYGHWNAVSYNGPDSLNPPTLDPRQLWNELFNSSPGADELELGRRVNVLDAVLEDARSLRARLGASDRLRLDAHLTHLSAVQRRLDVPAPTCDTPPAPGATEDLLAKTELMAELLAVALRCGLTRVFSFMLTSPATTHVFGNLGAQNGMHVTVHEGHWNLTRAIADYQMQCFGRVLDVLGRDADPTGETLLDRGLILGTSEYGEGWKHSVAELPAVLAGGACGALRRGVHVREPGGNFSKVHVTALRALGLETPSFGFHGGETTDAVSGLLA